MSSGTTVVDHDTNALRILAASPGYQWWLAKKALEPASNGDQRVEILIARGLVTIRRLACATDLEHINYANSVLKTEMVNICCRCQSCV